MFKNIIRIFKDSFSSNGHNIPDLDVNEFMDKYKNTDNAVLLDVRRPEEAQEGLIGNAQVINYLASNFEDEINKLDNKTSYFIYCRSGQRSKNACKLMKKNGFDKVYNLKGGYIAWKARK